MNSFARQYLFFFFCDTVYIPVMSFICIFIRDKFAKGAPRVVAMIESANSSESADRINNVLPL